MAAVSNIEGEQALCSSPANSFNTKIWNAKFLHNIIIEADFKVFMDIEVRRTPGCSKYSECNEGTTKGQEGHLNP